MKPFTPNTQGTFTIPPELYHNHQAAPEISRSLVVQMVRNSPAHVKASIDGRVVKEVTPAMQIGTLVDHCLLEPDRFQEGRSHYILPDDYDGRTKDGKEWKKDHPLNIPGLPLRTDKANTTSIEDIYGMIGAVMRHKIARRIVEESVKQESAFAFDKETGLLRKCRPDTRLLENSGRMVLGDLKAIGPGLASMAELPRHCARQSWHVQDSFYGDIYRDLFNEQPFFLFFVVERKPPYAVRVFDIHEEGRAAAREQYKSALRQFQQCKATGKWEAYREEIETVRLPRWALLQQEVALL